MVSRIKLANYLFFFFSSNAHYYCRECIQRACVVAIGDGLTELKCLMHCDKPFPLASLQTALGKQTFSKWLKKIQIAEIEKVILMLLLIAQGFCYRIKAIHNNKTLIRRLAMKLVLSHSRIVTSLLGKSPENIFNTAYNPKKCCPCLQNFLYCKLSIMVFFSGGTLGPGTVPILSVRHHYGRAEGGEQTLRVSESGMWQRELSSLPRGLAHSTPMRGGREGRRGPDEDLHREQDGGGHDSELLQLQTTLYQTGTKWSPLAEIVTHLL